MSAPIIETTAEATSPVILGELLARLESKVNFHYPGLLPSVKCGLAVFGSMAFRGRTKPLTIVYEATSGFGKSAVVDMFFPAKGSGLITYAYRCDKFTPRSFVSHIAARSETDLRKIDLLPQLENKVLLAKELSPLFRGRDEEMRENFSILIPVLDGKGFTSNSGVHGKRGYEKPILFNWIGATTPLPRETHHIMYQLGTRLLFYEVPSVPPNDEELLRYAERDDVSQAEVECQAAVNDFLADFFKQHPVGSVAVDTVELPTEILDDVIKWARFLIIVRAGVKNEKVDGEWEAVGPNHPEGPYKIIGYFKDLMRGHALVHGRSEATVEDLELAMHVAISSVPGYLRPILRALQKSGTVSSASVRSACGVSHPTARRYLRELEVMGIVTVEPGQPQDNTPNTARLNPGFVWLHRP